MCSDDGRRGVALAAGAWLGGERAALLMQSSGLGNCINMLSLARTCRFPLLMLITMRGEWEEFNPWQVPMGSIVDPMLKLCEAEVYRVHEPGEVAGSPNVPFSSPSAMSASPPWCSRSS